MLGFDTQKTIIHMWHTKHTTLRKRRWWWLKEETITNKFTYIPGKKAACWRFWAHENLHSESPGIRFVFKCPNHMHLNLIQTLVILGRKGNGTLKDDVCQVECS